MPKPQTFLTLYDELKTLSITKLKQWGYLEPNQVKSGTITWSRGEMKTGSISIAVYTTGANWYIRLQYTYKKEIQVDYKVNLVSKPSNLGIGRVWYFVCPHTGKRCRKLYDSGRYFLHRETIADGMYSTQTYSKYVREQFRQFNELSAMDKAYEKHFKRTYAGKYTKRYKRMLRQAGESGLDDREKAEMLRAMREQL